MYYYGARYYDPKASVWLGVDPKADKAPTTSPYTYCANNPIKFVDPDGMFRKFFGAVLYSIFHGGLKVSRDRTNGEYFVEKRNLPSTISNNSGMKEYGGIHLSGPEISHQRRYSWGGRSEPRDFPVQETSELPTIRAQSDDAYHYSENNYQARQEQAKFEKAKSDILNSDAVSFGSNETGLGAVQCLYEGLENASMILTIEASGVPKAIPTLGKWLNKLNEIQDLPAAINNIEHSYQESLKQSNSNKKDE